MKGLVIGLVIAGLLAEPEIANADPVGDFFKRLGNSISKAGKRQPARRTSRKSDSQPANTADPSVSATPGGALGPPSQQNIRVATAAPPAKDKKRDVPYGIPVPGRPGLVTSPFSPNGNYVDVRAFPPGAEVKDPYSGKIFRTP